jgi:hypothetical protein
MMKKIILMLLLGSSSVPRLRLPSHGGIISKLVLKNEATKILSHFIFKSLLNFQFEFFTVVSNMWRKVHFITTTTTTNSNKNNIIITTTIIIIIAIFMDYATRGLFSMLISTS